MSRSDPHDAAGRFQYAYNGGLSGTDSSGLVGGISLPNGCFITNTFDGNARMTGTWLYNSTATALDYAGYTYNQGNQRTIAIREEPNSVSNNYTYDKIGEVVGDKAYEESGTARLNEQLGYLFDPAGNLNYRTNNALVQNFHVNAVNELTTNTNSGTLTVVGTTTSPATLVTVNGSPASLYGDATFAAGGLSLTTAYTATAHDAYGRVSASTVSVSISPNVTFQYDGNGNLTNDGLRNFVYDDENELIQVSVSNQWMSQFSYDAKMRRRIRKEFTWQGSWVQTNLVQYIYDGNLVIQERDINNVPIVTYTRGSDLSGSLQGAGGIGGLLARTSNPGLLISDPNANLYYQSDGNGNVAALLNLTGKMMARYRYVAE